MARRRAEPLLRPVQARYVERLAPPFDAAARELESAAAKRGWRVVAPGVARLYSALAAREPGGRIVELGCAAGYGTLFLARGAAQGKVTAVDSAPEMLELARDRLTRAGVGERVELVAGPVLEAAGRLAGPIDLAVVDAARCEPRRALDALLPLVKLGGTLVFAGLLGSGEIADPARRAADDPRAVEIERFNPYLMIHPQLATVLLPLGDGVGLAVKRRPTMRELGGPF